jgi:putative phosphoesterase|tara:strand:- start:4910 stop:5620 length:711 start_codon:yes stop_codon:yes gene_type:complete
MKIGILGDIHGNKHALKAVLDAAKINNVKKLFITGDLVGYYPYINEVLDLLDPWEKEVVKGNHEEMLYKAISNKKYLHQVTKKYGTGLGEAISMMSKERLKELSELKHPIFLNTESKSILICHGSPEDINEYIYPDADLSKIGWIDDCKADIIFFGHTHYPMDLKYKKIRLINPGSVGQPRNRSNNNGAHWVLYNTNDNTFDFKTEEYDLSELIKYVKVSDPDSPYLHRVFNRKND